MTQTFKFISTRNPDFSLNPDSNTKGWTLKPFTPTPKARIAQKSVAPNPAALLLSENQISKIANLSEFRLGDAASETNTSTQRLSDPRFDELYRELHRHYIAKNCVALEATASQYLLENPVKSFAELNSTVQRIYQFFTGKRCGATQQELLAFFKSISQEDLIDYVNTLFTFFEEIKCQILASQVLGQLGQYEYNLIDLLNSNLAFFVLGSTAYKADIDVSAIPAKSICTILEMDAFLPDWMFDLDPCKCKIHQGPADGQINNPLATKTSSIAAYHAKMQEKLSNESNDGQPLKRDADLKANVNRPHPHPDCQPTEDKEPGCDCNDHCKPLCLPPDPCCAEINYYVTDLMVLREETTCYKPSDLAYIENVAPFETRQRKHAFIKRIEDFAEDEVTKSRSEERDHQVTDRFSLQKKIESEISASLDVEATFGKQGGPYSVTTNASLSKDVAQKEARETFREAIDKAVLKIQSETRELHSRRETTEESEKNKHVFDNQTDLPQVTKYFWVSQEKRGQVYSHGLRGMVELLIPSPAMLYEHLEKLKAERAFNLEKPKHPCIRIEDIVPERYKDYVIEYDLTELPTPPTQPADQSIFMVLDAKPNEKHWSIDVPVTIPGGFTAKQINLVVHKWQKRFLAGQHRVRFYFGGKKVQKDSNSSSSTNNSDSQANIDERNSGVATITTLALKLYEITVSIFLEADRVDFGPWQLTVYKAIIEKYEEELRRYEEALAEHNRRQEDARIQGRHPFAAKEIIDAEIMRAAIYMMCDELDDDGVMNLKSEPCGYPEINRRTAGETTWDWYFFDRAFDWRLMSYKFYDYFRNPMCTWPDKFDPGDSNYMFNAFLRAGYVRVQIPVTPAMDQDVLWFINTRQKWGSGGTIPQNPSDLRWLSVVEEIKHSYDVYQNDREGVITAIVDASNNNANTNQVLITGSDRYWDVLGGTVDQNAVNLDLNREIYIDGIAYCITNIEPDPNSPPYNPIAGSNMQWVVSLNRIFEGEAFADPTSGDPKKYNYAIGAKYIGAPFLFELPTNLIWVGDHENTCLPCFPIECARETVVASSGKGGL